MDLGLGASEFGAHRTADNERLFGELVTELTSTSGGSRNHEALLREILRQNRHHQFADPEPNKVSHQYRELGDRLESLARYDKQVALQQLGAEVQPMQSASGTLDFGARIQTLMYYLSNRPLESDYIPGPILHVLVDSALKQEEERNLVAEIRAELAEEDQNTAQFRYVGYSDSSDLSDWSEDEDFTESLTDTEDDKENLPRQQTETRPEARLVDEWQEEVCKGSLSDLLSNYTPPVSADTDPQPGSLSAILAGNLDFEALEVVPRLVTNKEIIAEAIAAMRGCKIKGKALQWDAAQGQFCPAPCIHTCSLSPSLLCNILSRFASTGTAAVRVLDYISSDTPFVNPTEACLRSAIREEMRSVTCLILEVERSLERLKTSQQLFSYLTAEKHISARLQAISLALSATQQHQMRSSQSSELSAHRSSRMIDELCTLFHQSSIQSYSTAHSHAEVYARLLLGAVEPLLGWLDAWLNTGRLPQHHSDFFIEEGERAELDSPRFWLRAYQLRARTSEFGAAWPSCLDGHAERLLEAGKTNLMLRAHRSRASSTDSPAAVLPLTESCLRRHFASCIARYVQKAVVPPCKIQDDPEGQTSLTRSEVAIGERMRLSSVDRIRVGKSAPFSKQLWGALLPPMNSNWEQNTPKKMDHGHSVQCSPHCDVLPSVLQSEPKSFELQNPSHPPVSQVVTDGEDAWKDDVEMLLWMSKVKQAMHTKQDGLYTQTDQLHTTAVSSFTGCVSRMLWQDSSCAETMPPSLQEQQDCSVVQADGQRYPAAAILMEKCLLSPLRATIECIEAEVLAFMRRDCHIQNQLDTLKSLFICGPSPLGTFKLEVAGKLAGGATVPDLDVAELQILLEQCLMSSEVVDNIPGIAQMTVNVNLEEHKKIISRLEASELRRRERQTANVDPPQFLRTLAELVALEIHFNLPWPLLLIVEPSSLKLYNRIFVFFLQLRWAQASVSEAKMYLGDTNQRDKLVTALMLMHMLSSIETFAATSLRSLWEEFTQVVESAQSLSEIQKAHSSFLQAAAGLCMISTDGSWRVIYSVLRKLTDLSLHFQDLTSRLKKAEGNIEECRKLERHFVALNADLHDRHRYLLKALTNKSLKIGNKSGLQDLVMLLNFNQFY